MADAEDHDALIGMQARDVLRRVDTEVSGGRLHDAVKGKPTENGLDAIFLALQMAGIKFAKA